MGVPQRETQQTAYILIQGQFSFIHQLHDGEGGEHFGYGSGPESGFAGNGQIFLAGLFGKVPVAGEMGVGLFAVFIHFHPQSGHVGAVMAHHGIQFPGQMLSGRTGDPLFPFGG